MFISSGVHGGESAPGLKLDTGERFTPRPRKTRLTVRAPLYDEQGLGEDLTLREVLTTGEDLTLEEELTPENPKEELTPPGVLSQPWIQLLGRELTPYLKYKYLIWEPEKFYKNTK